MRGFFSPRAAGRSTRKKAAFGSPLGRCGKILRTVHFGPFQATSSDREDRLDPTPRKGLNALAKASARRRVCTILRHRAIMCTVPTAFHLHSRSLQSGAQCVSQCVAKPNRTVFIQEGLSVVSRFMSPHERRIQHRPFSFQAFQRRAGQLSATRCPHASAPLPRPRRCNSQHNLDECFFASCLARHGRSVFHRAQLCRL
ncbi:hypothetical protein Bxe_A1510 [Paraburkholderia xenovorans LB400]|uniref:Uncharacterized protein n=1 Tax=Paraburkholderia xenovorans (strain LB400) TaxID=266265 RepID=Q13WU5_PARXL|nr:hypothetical protein Bxe_A1510 [Paraburkholderia xenovorans LB400]